MKMIHANELKQQIETGKKLTILEALPAKYYLAGHIPGALQIAHDAMDQAAGELVPSKDADVVVYCASGTCENSHIAAARLRELGYQNVRVFPGGKAEWKEHGFELVAEDAQVAIQ